MKIYRFKDLSKQEVEDLCSRQLADDETISSRVNTIITTVKNQGDQALFQFAKDFDGIDLNSLVLEETELKKIADEIPAPVKSAIDVAYQNIYNFHLKQHRQEEKIDTMPGVTCWRESRAIARVGLYIPGGTAVLPSTFLMLGIPAKIAGCKEIVVCSPPQKDGKINCYIAYVACLLGIKKIHLVGGAQAIAAMAFGTETLMRVDKIFGPGNRYVTEAKKLLQNRVAIDMPAGPSEVLIVADSTAKPAYVAADLLAQAEHGTDSQAVLVTHDPQLAEACLEELAIQLSALPRQQIASQAMANSYIMLTQNIEESMAFSNVYAPEHLILASTQFKSLIPMIENAGSVFLGNHSPESVGDYASGTNHTLPTSGYAKSYSGVSLDTFIKKITFQELSPEGLTNIAKTVETLAIAEGLIGHQQAVTIRMNDLKKV